MRSQVFNLRDAEASGPRSAAFARLLGVLDASWAELQAVATSILADGTRSQEDNCRRATEAVLGVVRSAGFSASILEGDVPTKNTLSPEYDRYQWWSVHSVALVRLDECWVVVDFTASQLPRFQDVPVVINITEPSFEALKEVLHANYGWWIGGSRTAR